MSSFFEGANHMKFSGGQSFTSANTIIHNFYNHQESTEQQSEEPSSSRNRNDELWLTLPGGQQRLRLVEMCDINMLQEISSGTAHMLVKPRALNTSNPFREWLENEGGTVKIRRRIRSAEIVQFGDRRFTVVSFEPEDSGDVQVDEIRKVLQPMFEVALSHRQVWLPQLFGLGRSVIPTLIYYDEIVGGIDIITQYLREGFGIVEAYLLYKFSVSHVALVSSGDVILRELSIRAVSQYLRDWRFNHKTRSFQYDITSYVQEEPQKRVTDCVLSLPPSCNDLPLDPSEIIGAFPEYLDLISDSGETICVDHSVTDFVHHDIITFGAVVDRRKPGLLWHFSSTPTPEWDLYHYSHGSDIVAKRSLSVPSLFELTSMKKVDIRMNTHFTLGLKHQDRQQLRTAYLIQSNPFIEDYYDCENLFFIDQVNFALVGTFTSNPSTSHPPKYLHVPPLSPEWINGMPCLRWPLTTSTLFYWSADRNGKLKIAEEHWEKYGIPKLKVQIWIGSCWQAMSYLAASDYLAFKDSNYESGGTFAKEHGYPILVKGDPHVQGEVEKHPERGDFRALVLKFREVVKAEKLFQKITKGKEKDRGLNLQINTPVVLGQASF